MSATTVDVPGGSALLGPGMGADLLPRGSIPTIEPKRIAIVGFTASRSDAPVGKPGWDLWGMNSLHRLVDASRYSRWYNLHDRKTIDSDPEHLAWLQTTTVPVYVWDPDPSWPTAVRFPKEEVVERFGRYFTNSVAWMIAHAIMEQPVEIGVYGVDMAQDTEYAAQRPSCEYFLGMALGMGIEVTIPETSDLLKSVSMYGVEGGGAFRAKLEQRMSELQERFATTDQQRAACEAQLHQLRGAIETTQYYLGVWTQPSISRDGQSTATSGGPQA